MSVSLRALLILILVHGLYLLPGGSLRRAALPILGGLLLLLILALLLPSARRALERSIPEPSRADRVVLGLAALLPPVAAWLSPRVVVWTIGSGSGLAIAWTVLCLVLVRANEGDARLPLVRTVFFVATSCVWLSVLWDLGLGQMVTTGVNPPGFVYDRLDGAIFPTWNEYPVSAHWFLGAYTPAEFEAGAVYTGHPAPMLMVWYLITLGGQLLGLPLTPATLAIPFVYTLLLALAVCWLLSLAPGVDLRDRLDDYLTVFLLLGILVTMATFWESFLEHNRDNVFPLAMYLIAALCPLVLRGDTCKLGFWCLALAVALLAPVVMAPLAISCWFVMSPEQRAATSKGWTALVLGVALASLAYPKIAAALLGYTDVASSLAFRSGLDGDTTFFTDAVQAVLAPREGDRDWWQLVYPALLPVAFLLAFARRAVSANRASLVKMATILLSPYAFFVVFFPQVLSIHPYLFDYLLQFGILVTFSAAVLTPAMRSRLRGPLLLLALSVAMITIMANLLRIAQLTRLSLAASQ